MTIEGRLRALEAKFADLEAMVDGGEAQTREATVYIVGIVTRFLHEKGLIDERALRNYVRNFEGSAADADDHLGSLVRQLGGMIDFHDRHPIEFGLRDGIPASGPRPEHDSASGA